MAFFRDSKFPGTVVRLFNTVGPRQTGRYGMVIPRFVSKAISGEPVSVYGTGKQSRCFCHVLDTIRALKSLISNEEAIGKVVNIGSSESISIYELAEFVIKRLNSSSSIELIPYEKAYEKGFEDMLHRAPDTKLVNKLVGWEAKLSLEKIVDDVAEYIKKTGKV
jgi:UDP-glucose 4-epimerase